MDHMKPCDWALNTTCAGKWPNKKSTYNAKTNTLKSCTTNTY